MVIYNEINNKKMTKFSSRGVLMVDWDEEWDDEEDEDWEEEGSWEEEPDEW